MNTARFTDPLFTLLGAEMEDARTLIAHDSLGRVQFRLTPHGAELTDERDGATPAPVLCPTPRSALLAILPSMTATGEVPTGTLLTPLGRMEFSLSIVRNLRGDERDARLQLDTLQPIRSGGQPLAHVRLFAYRDQPPQVIYQREPGTWRHDPHATLLTAGRTVARAAWQALWSPTSEARTRTQDARTHLTHCRTQLAQATARREDAERALHAHTITSPSAFFAGNRPPRAGY